ncbi:MAN1A2 [Symbiodinium pilosum]|uniref:alpha-1,2-Mannosidase n=1 Tax=Symbiodinium pilosum TaxID=2952 RepID=A0A812T0G0_SYMPI|nr:MAN1A2 [Symbiodinium pilosum]
MYIPNVRFGPPLSPALRGTPVATADRAATVAAAAAAAASPAAACDFQPDVDYFLLAGKGKEEMVRANSNKAECCQLCAEKNRLAPVASAKLFARMAAGSLQLSALKAYAKAGVTSCFPPGHGEIPKVPTTPPVDNSAVSDHDKSLALLVTSANTQELRANAIRDAIRHAWSSYKTHAWGNDELLPIAGKGRNRGFNMAVTMVDSLDTLWLAGLKDEFIDARDWLAAHFHNKINAIGKTVSVFETTIRVLGGLLSAYDLSQEKIFLDLAVKLGQKILGVVTARGVTPYTFAGGRGGSSCPSLAESGTLQLEMRYLSHVTGDAIFAAKTMKFYETVQGYQAIDGLWPNCFERGRGKITMGADGDSFYEYLLKVWIQGGKRPEEDFLKGMYDKAVEGMEKHMVKKGADGLTYLGTATWDNHGVSYVPEMEHLTCFVPGWIGLGAQQLSEDLRQRRMKLADDIAYTCWQMYEKQPTGIAPERVKGEAMDLSKTNTKEYILRPEASEGWWYMWELTKEPKYREWGWKTFLAFEKWLWVPHGYASLKDVRQTSKTYMDRMESFFIAETLKYLLLLQDETHGMKLDRYVFNTEAHPLSILEFAPKP